MRKIRTAILFSICLAGFFFASCRKFSANPSWDTQILAPLITTTLSINDLVTDSLVHSNPDSSITLVYNGSIYNLNTDSLVKLPDTSFTSGYVVSGTVTPGQNLGGSSAWTKYGTGSVQLTKATVQSGYIVVTVTNAVPGLIDFTYSIPSATLGGNPFTANFKVNPAIGSNPTITIDSFPLNNYQLDLTGQFYNGYNSIYTTATAIFDPSNPTITIGTDGVGVSVTFHDVIPYYAQGYFGTSTKTFTQTSPFSIFSKEITNGSLSFQSLNVNLTTLQNDIGVDAQIKHWQHYIY